MGVTLPRIPSVPPLGNIESRAGLREFISVLYRYLIEVHAVTENLMKTIGVNLTPNAWAPSVASAATIEPLAAIQPISGTTTVTTINAGPGATRFTLLAEAGFALATGGNIAAAATVPIGTAVEVYLNHNDNLWYPQT